MGGNKCEYWTLNMCSNILTETTRTSTASFYSVRLYTIILPLISELFKIPKSTYTTLVSLKR